MGEISNRIPAHSETCPSGIEDRLIWLCRFGEPRVLKMSGGWHACIEMNTNTTGSKFEVRTDFNCGSPYESIDQLISRMCEALAALARP